MMRRRLSGRGESVRAISWVFYVLELVVIVNVDKHLLHTHFIKKSENNIGSYME